MRHLLHGPGTKNVQCHRCKKCSAKFVTKTKHPAQCLYCGGLSVCESQTWTGALGALYQQEES